MLIENILRPLQDAGYHAAHVIDCLNWATSYPRFFQHEYDPNVLYVFVTRGEFCQVPNRRGVQFKTSCDIPERVTHTNVMCITACSSFLYTKKIDKTSRCAFKCVVPETLFGRWYDASGYGQDGPTRVHGGNSSFKLTDAISVDTCQIDDFMVSVVAAILVDAGKRVRIYSKDGRFRSQTLQLPRIRYPFYCVVQSVHDEVGVPIYQKDSKQLYESIRGRFQNPDYVQPYIDEAAPIWRRGVNTEQVMQDRYAAWSRARTKLHIPTVPSVSVAADYNFIESPVSGLSESEYLSLEELEHEAFVDGGESNCSSVRNAPAMRTISLEELQRKAGARRRCGGLKFSLSIVGD